jgi:hypothetical protein
MRKSIGLSRILHSQQHALAFEQYPGEFVERLSANGQP